MEARKYSEAYMRNMINLCMHPCQKKIEHFGGGELLILAFLSYHNNSLSPKELSQITATSTAHVAKALRNLEAKGEIRRQADTTDARKKVVSVTKTGMERVENARLEILNDLDRIMEALGEEDAAQLVRLSGRIARLAGDRMKDA